MVDSCISLIVSLLLLLAAEFVNGWTDAPNAIATVVSTRTLTPRTSVLMASLLNIAGALSGTAVAVTIGEEIIDPSLVSLATISTAMTGIILWSTLAWRYGLPTSETHALVAGLTGAGIATAGPNVVIWSGWVKVFYGLALSLLSGFAGGYLISKTIRISLKDASPPQARRLFGRLQILSAAFMAYSHGLNDGQKFIGAFALSLLIGGVLERFHIPLWVILLCASVMGAGTALGGWRIIRTMGSKITKLQTYQGFSAETGAATTITLASQLGIPLSTTHTIGASIIGVGASGRISAVKWGVVRQIVVAWILTFPVCGTIAFVATKVILSAT